MKYFSIILLFLLVAIEVFPDSDKKDTNKLNFWVRPELATIDFNTYFSESSINGYWKFNILPINFTVANFVLGYQYVWQRQHINFKITPLIITNIKSSEFSFFNFEIYYYLYREFAISVAPKIEINYFIINDGKFNYNRFDIQTGIKLGLLNLDDYSFFYVETGYAYNHNKSNNHNYYFLVGVSLLFFDPFFLITRTGGV